MTYTHEDLDLASSTQLREFARETGFKGFSKLKVKELRDALRARLPSRDAPQVPLFVELCAGTAALSLRLHQEGAKPPVSRMGAKTGYAVAILHTLGLYPGQQAERYLWCEPDAGVRLLLHAYTDRDLAQAAADIIRSWKDEDPRALWERLRAEGPARCPDGMTAREVARWAYIASTCHESGTGRGGFVHPEEGGRFGAGREPTAGRLESTPTVPATITEDATEVDPREVARWVYVADLCYERGNLRTGYRDDLRDYQRGTRGKPRHAAVRNSENMADLPTVPATISEDACEVDPREVARWAYIQSANTMIALDENWRNTGKGGSTYYSRDDPRRCGSPIANTPTLPATVTEDATEVDPRVGECHPRHDSLDEALGCWRCQSASAAARDGGFSVPKGTVVYIDPPYVGTTGYAHALDRAAVVDLALKWHAAGATVAVSEAEPIPELVALGWRVVDITDKRQGQKRTFSKQKAEYLTISPES